MDSVSYLLFALLPTGLEDVKVVGVRVEVVHGIQLLEALGEDVHLDWIGFGKQSATRFHLGERHDERKIFLASTFQSLACLVGKLLGICCRNDGCFCIGDVSLGIKMFAR